MISRLPTPSAYATNKEVLAFSHPEPSLPVLALPFGLFTVHRETSLGGGEGGLTMTLQGTTIHQYGWSVNASSYQTCFQHIQSLVALCQE